MFNKKIFGLSLLLVLFLGLVISMPVLAQDADEPVTGDAALFNNIQRDQLTPLAKTGLPGTTDGEEYDLLEKIAQVIKVALGTLVMIFMTLLIYAGFKWMTSGGNEETITKSKKIISAALIGVTVIFFAYAITVFVFNLILNNRIA